MRIVCRFTVRFGGILLVCPVVFACVRVPNVDTEKESIRIVDIVRRVKCDIYYALSQPKETSNGIKLVPLSTQPGFEWLSTWNIQSRSKSYCKRPIQSYAGGNLYTAASYGANTGGRNFFTIV